MLTRPKAKRIIKETVKTSIISFAKRNINKKSTFQILDLLIPNERRIRSVVGGLETSLGTTLWEPLAKALAKENGFEVINDKLEIPINMPSNLSNALTTIIDERKRKGGAYTAISSHKELRKVCQIFLRRKIESFEPAPKGRGVDIWLRKGNVNYFFDTKTVQPNLGNLTDYTEQLLTWYAYFYSRYPKARAQARIVFPYNPYNGDFWERTIGKGFPLQKNVEGWVENEFWDFCSGLKGTYKLIKESFSEIGESKELEKELKQLFYRK